MRPVTTAALIAALVSASCGYRVAGRADLMPKHVRTIAVPAFKNLTTRYQLTERLPSAIGREFLSRTRYQVVAEAEAADAVLEGTVEKYNAWPTIFDPATGRASAVQISVTLSVALRERATGQLLFARNHFEVRERYEISAVDQKAYFEESETALERLSRDVARSVVSAVLERF